MKCHIIRLIPHMGPPESTRLGKLIKEFFDHNKPEELQGWQIIKIEQSSPGKEGSRIWNPEWYKFQIQYFSISQEMKSLTQMKELLEKMWGPAFGDVEETAGNGGGFSFNFWIRSEKNKRNWITTKKA